VTNRNILITCLALCGLVLLAVVGATAGPRNLGFSELSNGRGGTNVEAFVVPDGFDKAKSLAAFKETLYPLLRANCSGCHSTENKLGSGAQAPLHADVDVNLAHEYALTRVNFRDPENSKLVVRMGIDRHNCFAENCGVANKQMLAAVTAWRDRIADMVPPVPRGVELSTKITEEQVMNWIAADKAKVPAADREFIQYASFHQLHNAGVSALNMNHARVGLSKALNTAARWAPKIVNPVDVNGKGILYRFDIRDYWGYTLIDTSAPDFALWYGGSDDDLAFAPKKIDLNGKPIAYNSLLTEQHKLKSGVTRDEKFARLVWARVLKGNAEAATNDLTHPPNIAGFIGPKKMGANGQEYIEPSDLQYIEASQLTYTLTRPDVYNAILAIPGYMWMFEQELGVDKSKGVKSYDYMVTKRAITIDSRFYYRAETPTGYYWKTYDIFTEGNADINAAYKAGKVTYPFWQNPIPKFVKNQGGTTPEDLTYVATLPLGSYANGKYTGGEGAQASAEEMIWSLPNGLQAYALFGAWSQRRVDAFTQIVRDPRLQRYVEDRTNSTLTGTGRLAGVTDQRLNNASSCIGCHIDGMNRSNNDIRDWLDEGGGRIPKGENGAGEWVNDPAVTAHVRELYPPSSEMRVKMESDRRQYLGAMAQVKQGMALGVDKNTYVEPTIWTIEWAQHFYKYPETRSN
jgi:hypothetical protein